ncbi:MAG: FecR family protein [Daejeonella sp.]|uniref:FecR family protein n=1 Tax=Daejeonella sp. JGW-45 TaxID=3034148 RepID=UPI0023EC45FF|nr:FecR family protein [Daejeonella sp. JGW-45]
MDKKFFIHLLHKYNNGTATPEERRLLFSYYELFDADPEVPDLSDTGKGQQIKDQVRGNIWNEIDRLEARQDAPDPGRHKLWFSLAAAILIVVSAGLYFYPQIPSVNAGRITQSYQNKEHRLINLPDGSTVIVAAGSKLNYPSSFDGFATREVYLEGEAYFDIQHNASKPFIVRTGKVATTVLGTAFNIKAWPLDEDITVTVNRGKVRLAAGRNTLGILTPNQQITYNKHKADVVKRHVQAAEYLSWKQEDLLLDNVTVLEAAKILEDRFRVSISITEEPVRIKRFTTTFLKGESLEQVLKSICEFNDAVYTYDKQEAKVILSSK